MNHHLSRALRRVAPAVGLAVAALAIGAVLGAARSSVAATAAAPTEKSMPTISGTAQENRTLTANQGSWSGTSPITFSYQWRRCDTGGNACVDIAGATSQTYKVASSDVDHTLRVFVTARNSSGSASDSSHHTAVVLPDPGETSPPSISGSPTQGKTLTANHGGWIGTSSISFSYQWERCDTNGDNCNNIGGADGRSYTLVSDDVGHTLRVHVTAKDDAGSTSDTSGKTSVITGLTTRPVAGSSPPSISGSPTEGQTLTASTGSWSGSSLTFRYQWRRCNSHGNECGDIRGATSQSYKLASSDVGHTIRVRVVASNSAGSAANTSAPTPVIAKAPPTSVNGCPTGNGPINVSQVSLPAQLTIDGLQSSPATIGRNPGDVTVRFHVSACGGRSVAGALVYATAVPFNQFSIPAEAATGSDGWVSEVMHQQSGYPASSHQHLLAVFVRARKPGENVLGGISARRLVSFPVNLHQ